MLVPHPRREHASSHRTIFHTQGVLLACGERRSAPSRAFSADTRRRAKSTPRNDADAAWATLHFLDLLVLNTRPPDRQAPFLLEDLRDGAQAPGRVARMPS